MKKLAIITGTGGGIGKSLSFNLIDKGYNVVLWPDDVKEKDINDMILADIPVEDIIKNNTYQGAAAQLRFAEWRKINAKQLPSNKLPRIYSP